MSNLGKCKKGIRIETNGEYWNTHIIDLETGNEIHGVTSVSVEIDAGTMPPRATLEVIVEELDIKLPYTFHLGDRLPDEDSEGNDRDGST